MGISALLSTQILDSSSTGRSVLTGASAASIRTVLGLGTTDAPTFAAASLSTGTITVSNPAINATQTWNNAATTFTASSISITDTASNAASLLANWSVGGNSFFSVAKDGSLNAGRFGVAGFQGLRFTGGALTMSRSSDGGSMITLDTNSNGVTAGSFTASNGRLTLWDSFLSRDATNVVAVRDLGTGTNPCGFRVYNTYTDASNYERARMAWESNQFVIGHEYLGTGAARSVAIVGGQTGTQGVVKASTGGVLIGAQLNLSNSSNASAAASQVVLYTPASGQLRLTNATSNNFDRLILGPDTSSFPSLKRNGSGIDFRNGDDTAYSDITVRNLTVTGTSNVGGGSGGASRFQVLALGW